MDHASRSSLTRALLLALALALSAAGLAGCEKTPAPAQARLPQAAAQQRLEALPELKAWAAFIERRSGGKAHGALLADGAQPRIVEGTPYWAFGFVENGELAVHRWESFMVSAVDGSVRVEDAVDGRLLTLEQWRAGRPLDRIAG